MGCGSKAMKPRRVGGTSPDVGCSLVSGSICRFTSPVDPSCDVGVGLSEHRGDDVGGATETDAEVPSGESVGVD